MEFVAVPYHQPLSMVGGGQTRLPNFPPGGEMAYDDPPPTPATVSTLRIYTAWHSHAKEF